MLALPCPDFFKLYNHNNPFRCIWYRSRREFGIIWILSSLCFQNQAFEQPSKCLPFIQWLCFNTVCQNLSQTVAIEAYINKIGKGLPCDVLLWFQFIIFPSIHVSFMNMKHCLAVILKMFAEWAPLSWMPWEQCVLTTSKTCQQPISLPAVLQDIERNNFVSCPL